MPHEISGGRRCFRILGRASYEPEWHPIDVFASHRRDRAGGWPLIRGTCITWSAHSISVGWDFAAQVLREQLSILATREAPVIVRGGRLRASRAGEFGVPTASEILAHECGHTGQARQLGVWYWPLGATFTLFREGERRWNWFENGASATGQFGGIMAGSIDERLMVPK